MPILIAIFLGIVQGVTEFLPISSSGHLSILQNIWELDYSEEEHLLFDVMLHLGTLVAVCFVYRKDIMEMIRGVIKMFKGELDFSAFGDPMIPPTRQALFIVAATLPLFIALIFNGAVSRLFSSTGFIAFALIVTGTILFISDKYVTPGHKTAKSITLKDAVIIGLAQACAVIPGLSRSGTTIAVGMTCGLTRNYAMRFSLLLSIPAVIGSLIVSLIKAAVAGINWSLIPVYLVGFLFSAIVGFLAIHLLKYIINKNKFGRFSYYCWAVGGITLILSIII